MAQTVSLDRMDSAFLLQAFSLISVLQSFLTTSICHCRCVLVCFVLMPNSAHVNCCSFNFIFVVLHCNDVMWRFLIDVNSSKCLVRLSGELSIAHRCGCVHERLSSHYILALWWRGESGCSRPHAGQDKQTITNLSTCRHQGNLHFLKTELKKILWLSTSSQFSLNTIAILLLFYFI